MSEHVVSSSTLGMLLVAEGLLPQDCTAFEIVTDVGQAVRLRYTVHLTQTRLVQLRMALSKLGLILDRQQDEGMSS